MRSIIKLTVFIKFILSFGIVSSAFALTSYSEYLAHKNIADDAKEKNTKDAYFEIIPDLNRAVVQILAEHDPTWQTQDKELLSYTTHSGKTVAHLLAVNNPSWVTNNYDILKLKDSGEDRVTVAHLLAIHRQTWVTQDYKILSLYAENGFSVAHYLAFYGNSRWETTNKQVLKLSSKYNLTVAHMLARHHNTWFTTEEDILNLKNNSGITVANLLEKYKPNVAVKIFKDKPINFEPF